MCRTSFISFSPSRLKAMACHRRLPADSPELAGKVDSDLPRVARLRAWQVNGFPNYIIYDVPLRATKALMSFVCFTVQEISKCFLNSPKNQLPASLASR